MNDPGSSPFDVDRLTRLGRVAGVVPSPCGSFVAVEVQRLDADEGAYISDLWRVSLVEAGGAPQRLTRGGASDRAPCFRADGALGFLSNRNPRDGEPEDGDRERAQVWLLPAGGGEPRPLTDEPLGVREFRFARAADRLVVLADVLPDVPEGEQRARAAAQRKRGPTGLRYRAAPVRHWDHWLPVAAPHFIAYDAEGRGRRDLTPDADRDYRGMEPGDWDVSPDGARLATTAARPGPDRFPDTALRVIDLDSGHAVDLGAIARVNHHAPRFAPDSARVACARDPRTPGQAIAPRLHLYDLDNREERPVAADWDAWPQLAGWTGDGAALVVTADWQGCVPVFRVDVASDEVTRVTDEGAGGSHGSLHVVDYDDGVSVVIGARHRLTHPPEPFRAPLVPGAAPELLACLSGLPPDEGAALVTVESCTVPGEGDAPVQYFVVQPAGGAAAPRPGLLWIHGGPMGQHADGWHWRWNALVPAAAGYAVALPNPRGSTGFGQQFVQGVWNNTWGGACYNDLMAVTDALAARPDVDGDRLAAMGGSFGGYMANWIAVNTDRFRCLVSHAGIYWMGAFHGTTDYPGFFAYEMGLDPYDDPETFDRYSPHRRVADWKTPTLIIHGEKDYRVPISEALLLYEALGIAGVEAELLVFPDENHWILRPQNSRQWYRAILDFAARHVQPS